MKTHNYIYIFDMYIYIYIYSLYIFLATQSWDMGLLNLMEKKKRKQF